MENILTFDGYTYNTDTREITFTTKVCWQCDGKKEVTRGISCPRYGRKQRGKACEFCGSKSADNHKMIGTRMVTCNTCDGTGIEICTSYSSLNFSHLIQFIEIKTVAGLHGATFNESYLGLGIIGGCTDYGRYLEETGRDFAKILAHVRKETEERNSHTQGLNLLTADGHLISTAILKMNDSGWSLFSVGTKSSVI